MVAGADIRSLESSRGKAWRLFLFIGYLPGGNGSGD